MQKYWSAYYAYLSCAIDPSFCRYLQLDKYVNFKSTHLCRVLSAVRSYPSRESPTYANFYECNLQLDTPANNLLSPFCIPENNYNSTKW